MIKDLWKYSLEGEQWLEDWPNWLRWVTSLPLSYLGYAIFYWIVNLNNFFIFKEDTFLGYLFMDFFSSIMPLFIFYHIIPYKKAIISFGFTIIILFIHVLLILLQILLLLDGFSFFSEELMTFIPTLITTAALIISAKIFMNSIVNER